MRIAVLGAGMVGRTIALELSKEFDTTSFDIDPQSLISLEGKAKENGTKLKVRQVDLRTLPAAVECRNHILNDYDLVVSAVPGFMGYETLKAIITAGKDVVDISFFPENPADLSKLARENNVTAIVDFGVAPGMSNFILGYVDSIMEVDSFECLVGGLPKKRVKPFEYKAPFSPVDVLEEYTRPARYVENGHIVTKPALTDIELVTFNETGTLESFNTDGLRTLIHTMSHIPNMKEKTLRYPGHAEIMKLLISAGFLDIWPSQKLGISPIDFTSHVLFDKWKLGPEEPEFTIMNIKIQCGNQTLEYHMYDEFDKVTKLSSMSRTTGYAACAAVNLVADGTFKEKGVFPPEIIGGNAMRFMKVMNYLFARGIIYTETSKYTGKIDYKQINIE